MHIYFVGPNQNGADISETEASEKLNMFAFLTLSIYLKTSSDCVWEHKRLKYGRRKCQGRERDCDGFICVLSEMSKGIWLKVSPLIRVAVNRSKEKRNIPLGL